MQPSSASAATAIEANAIAAQPVAKQPDYNRDVQPIFGTSGAKPADKPTGFSNDTIGFARLRLA